MRKNVVIETKRLLLRPFTQDDFTAVHAYASNVENILYMPWGPNSEEDTHAFIERTIRNATVEPRREFEFAIELKESNRLIGGGEICLHDGNEGSCGWCLHMDHWRYGYGTEFAAALLKFGFEELKLRRIYAKCNSDNYGSFRIMERNGMRNEAHFKKVRMDNIKPGGWQDEYLYAILLDEWKERQIDYFGR
jgi:RimJ/RimL family protein N-acetyltransferase